MSTGLFSPPLDSPPRNHHRNDMKRYVPSENVDMSTLIWPPPHRAINSSPQSRSYHPDGDNPQIHLIKPSPRNPSSSMSPHGSPNRFSKDQGYIPLRPPPMNRKSRSTDQVERFQSKGLGRYESPITKGQIPYPMRPSTSRPSHLHSNSLAAYSHVPRTSDPPPGDKDYPSGYSPTPIPLLVPPNSYEDPMSSRARGAELPFFEPLVDLPSPQKPIPQAEFLSPVLENGRPVRLCRIPSNLTPGGVVEHGWPEEFSQGSATAGKPLGAGVPSLSWPQSPLRYQASPPPDSSSSQSEEELDTSPNVHPTSFQLSSYSGRLTPTRRGYWNYRGDTISASGRVQPAPASQRYPPDLAHYPKYALMNEVGNLVLPVTPEERINIWRSYSA